MEITGKIVKVLPTQSGQGKNGEWVKNSFVIEWQDNGYNQLLCLEVVGADKFEKMKNAVKVGCEVRCKFSVLSREWNGKYFTSCQCYYCSSLYTGQGQQQHSTAQAPQQQQGEQQSEDDSSLPF
jgi:hypothetical protein